MHLSPAIPVIRTFSEEKTKEFYLDFLGFSKDWEHRFDNEAPVYMQVRRSDLVLHLSEHYGDATPGSTIFVPMQGIALFHEELNGKAYKFARPGLTELPWGLQIEVADPFGNRIRFCQLSQ